MNIMNINEMIWNEGKLQKNKGCTYKIIHILFANWSRILKLATNQSLVIPLLSTGMLCKWSKYYIHEYSWKQEKLEKIVEQFRGVP